MSQAADQPRRKRSIPLSWLGLLALISVAACGTPSPQAKVPAMPPAPTESKPEPTISTLRAAYLRARSAGPNADWVKMMGPPDQSDEGSFRWSFQEGSLIVFLKEGGSAEAVEMRARIRNRMVERSPGGIASRIGTALIIYTADHNGYFPPAENWRDRLKPYMHDWTHLQFEYLADGENSYDMGAEAPLGIYRSGGQEFLVLADSSTYEYERAEFTAPQ